MKLTVEETPEFLTFPEDAVLPLIVEEINEKELPSKDGGTWTSLNFKFKILDVPSHLADTYGVLIGQAIYGSVSAKLTSHPDNKCRQWLEALLGMALESGMDLETSMLVGRKARGVVTNYTKNGSTVLNHKIKGLLPDVPVATAVAAAPAATALYDDPPF